MHKYRVAVAVKSLNDAYRLFSAVRDTVGLKENTKEHLRKFPDDLCYSIVDGYVSGWCFKSWYKYSEGLKIYTVEEFLNHYVKSVHKIRRRTRKIDF